MKFSRWLTRKERARMRDAAEKAGSASNWIKGGKKKSAITEKERARHAAANDVADRFGFPRPYPDLDAYPAKKDEPS